MLQANSLLHLQQSLGVEDGWRGCLAWCAYEPSIGFSVQHDEDLKDQHLDGGCRLLKEPGPCCAQACPDLRYHLLTPWPLHDAGPGLAAV